MEEQIEAVQRMQDYISENLFSEITGEQLAMAAMYSPWHSYRLFVRLLGMTPAVYIRKLRLSRSALRLRDEKVKVIDVALDCGFDSTDGFQRAFKSEFGCNPFDYSVRPVPIYLFRPYGIKYSQKGTAENMSETKNIFISECRRPARKVIIKRAQTADEYWIYCREVGCDVWGLLCSIKTPFGEPVCLWLPDKYIPAGTSRYVQGVEVPLDYDGAVPDGFDVIELPACDYLKFQGEPFEEKDFEEAIGQVWRAIEKFDTVPAGWDRDDDDPRIQLEPRGERGYIELVPVKKR